MKTYTMKLLATATISGFVALVPTHAMAGIGHSRPHQYQLPRRGGSVPHPPCKTPTSVPELNASASGSAFLLLAGCALLLGERRKRLSRSVAVTA